MKKIVCLFSCLLNINLGAIEENISAFQPVAMYILSMRRPESLDSLYECPIVNTPTPKRNKNGMLSDGCPIISSPTPKKNSDNFIEEEESTYLFFVMSKNSKK